MPDHYYGGDILRDISAIDTRLAELQQEKQRLIALKEELQKSRPTPPISDSLSPEQKNRDFQKPLLFYFYSSMCYKLSLLPLNGRRRFSGNVVSHTRNAIDLIDDAA